MGDEFLNLVLSPCCLTSVFLCVLSRLDDCNAPEVTAVGETPEKKQKQDMNVFGGPRVVSDRLPSPPVVPDTLSVPSVDNTESQKKKPLSRLGGSRGNKVMKNAATLWFLH